MVTITEETVAEAAERLLSDGKNPTQSAIRTTLGGGSFSTIGPLLQKWRERQDEAAELAEVDMPDTLANAGSELIAKVWKVAMAEAQAGHDAVRKELLQAQADTEAAQQETIEVATSLEADLAVHDEHITSLKADSARQADELKTVHNRAITAERELSGARERVQAETARADRADKHAEELVATVEKTEAERRSLRDRLDVTTSALADRTAEVARVTSERDHTQKALAASDARLTKAEAKGDKLHEDLTSVLADLSTARSDLATARAERSQADTKLKDAKTDLAEAKAELSEMKANLDETRTELSAVRNDLAKAKTDSPDEQEKN